MRSALAARLRDTRCRPTSKPNPKKNFFEKLKVMLQQRRAHSPHPPTTMSLRISNQQILDHRASKKTAGLHGCQNGRDAPLTSLFGISWKVDAKGRWADQEGYDPEDPACFCHDCRTTFDPDGSIDLKLLQAGHDVARHIYADLLPVELRPPPLPPVLLAKRTPGGGLSPLDTEQPTYALFEEIPTSLPAPRARDVMNETSEERLKGDLAALRSDLQGQIVEWMDKRRLAYDGPEATLISINKEVDKLWAKLKAVELLLQ